ncbi:MAG TPA: energy transducer TonB [Methylomirabilota bacterium]|nr:energy transducer TonB [Methylomirabilota bacterium]
MFDRRLGSSFSLSSNRETWLERVRENLAQLLQPMRLTGSSANGAPLHLLAVKRTARESRAQSLSLVIHALVIGALLALAARPPGPARPSPQDGTPVKGILFGPPADVLEMLRKTGSPGKGGSGDRDPRPATRGNFAPLSSIVFLRPQIPRNQVPRLPMNPAILDAEAPPLVNPPYVQLGLPWMKEYNDSAGPGCCKGIGSGHDGYMGDEDGPAAGFGGPRGYQPGMKMPSCAYCPDPPYTEEARKAKVQGIVTLEVLVGANGQALKTRIARGIGFGLDETAVQTVQHWRFMPARDAAGRPVAAWVPVEVAFRLF